MYKNSNGRPLQVFIGSFSPLTVGDSNQEDLCGRPVSEHNYRGRQAVLRPVWEGE